MEKRIIEGALHIVEKQGVKFTMDELASELGMSKKTIYTVFRDKNELLIAMVDYVFDYIKESEALVMEDKHLSLLQKIRKILGVMPENYTDFDFTQFYVLRDKHPEVYERVRQRLESGWEMTNRLLEQGVEEGLIRSVDFRVFQLVFESAVERFIMGDELEREEIDYMQALEELVTIMVDGIVVHRYKEDGKYERSHLFDEGLVFYRRIYRRHDRRYHGCFPGTDRFSATHL